MQMDYSRQLKLPFMTIAAQAKLAHAHIVVFGAGGLGCATLPYLAAAGVGHLSIVDPDRIESHNLHRQVLYSPKNIGEYKAIVSEKALTSINPQCQIDTYPDYVGGADLHNLCTSANLLIDCSDDAAFSLTLNKVACQLQMPIVFANASGMHGQLFVFNGSLEDACLACLWGDTPNLAQNCDSLGVLGPVPAMLGTLQALEAIKLLIQQPQVPALRNTLINYDLIHHESTPFTVTREPTCSHHLMANDPITSNEPAMTTDTIIRGTLTREATKQFQVIDICHANERSAPLQVDHQVIPMEELVDRPAEHLNHQQRYLLVCKTGKRSRALQQTLFAQGFDNISVYIP